MTLSFPPSLYDFARGIRLNERADHLETLKQYNKDISQVIQMLEQEMSMIEDDDEILDSLSEYSSIEFINIYPHIIYSTDIECYCKNKTEFLEVPNYWHLSTIGRTYNYGDLCKAQSKNLKFTNFHIEGDFSSIDDPDIATIKFKLYEVSPSNFKIEIDYHYTRTEGGCYRTFARIKRSFKFKYDSNTNTVSWKGTTNQDDVLYLVPSSDNFILTSYNKKTKLFDHVFRDYINDSSFMTSDEDIFKYKHCGLKKDAILKTFILS